MVNVEYLSYLLENKSKDVGSTESKKKKKKKKKFNELIELINVYHELQIPDTVMARNKEKMLKKYLQKISVIILLACYH